jgi:hypothetical protein
MVSENTESKISVLEKGLIEIQEMKDEELAEELYDVISTFGITNPANHKTISQFIESELQALKWYEENKHESICIAICNYIAGYCLYNFAIASPVHELFHLYYEIVEHDYFIKLGFKNEYWDQIQNKPDADEIYERIEEILKEFKPRFQNLPVTTHLNESSASGFLKSYLLFISNLNLS